MMNNYYQFDKAILSSGLYSVSEFSKKKRKRRGSKRDRARRRKRNIALGVGGLAALGAGGLGGAHLLKKYKKGRADAAAAVDLSRKKAHKSVDTAKKRRSYLDQKKSDALHKKRLEEFRKKQHKLNPLPEAVAREHEKSFHETVRQKQIEKNVARLRGNSIKRKRRKQRKRRRS